MRESRCPSDGIIRWALTSCDVVGLSRTAWYRERSDRLERDREVIEALQEIVEEHNRWGFWKYYRRLRLDGHDWNHKRVHRVYRDLGLNLRRCHRRF